MLLESMAFFLHPFVHIQIQSKCGLIVREMKSVTANEVANGRMNKSSLLMYSEFKRSKEHRLLILKNHFAT